MISKTRTLGLRSEVREDKQITILYKVNNIYIPIVTLSPNVFSNISAYETNKVLFYFYKVLSQYLVYLVRRNLRMKAYVRYLLR